MDDKETKKVIREIGFNVAMPNELKIGDPLYFEKEREDLVYNKKFRRHKTWVGNIRLLEEEITYEYEGETCKLTDINADITFAPTKERLVFYLGGHVYANHEMKTLQIGVDTATYDFVTNHSFETIHTGADGYWGHLTEIYMSSKLEGIMMNIGFPDLMTFEEVERILKRLFKEV